MTVTKEEFDKYFDNINLELAKTKEDMSEEKKEYRVAEQPNRITIEIKVLKTEKFPEVWVKCNLHGKEAAVTPQIEEYPSVDMAKKEMKRFIEGTIYHYPEE